MSPPPIPKPIRKHSGKSDSKSINNRRDVHKYINVSAYLDKVIADHNSKLENSSQCYETFSDQCSNHHRNMSAKATIERYLHRNIIEWYGKYTYSQCCVMDWKRMDLLVREIAADKELNVYTQTSNHWAIVTLISQKMESKSRKYRKQVAKNQKTSDETEVANSVSNSFPNDYQAKNKTSQRVKSIDKFNEKKQEGTEDMSNEISSVGRSEVTPRSTLRQMESHRGPSENCTNYHCDNEFENTNSDMQVVVSDESREEMADYNTVGNRPTTSRYFRAEHKSIADIDPEIRELEVKLDQMREIKRSMHASTSTVRDRTVPTAHSRLTNADRIQKRSKKQNRRRPLFKSRQPTSVPGAHPQRPDRNLNEHHAR